MTFSFLHTLLFFMNREILSEHFVQVNLCQKHLFMNQLTHNMTTNCPLIYNFLPRKIQIQNMLCTKIVLNAKTKTKNSFCKQHVLNASEKDLPVKQYNIWSFDQRIDLCIDSKKFVSWYKKCFVIRLKIEFF